MENHILFWVDDGVHQHNAFLENFYDFAVQSHYKRHHKSRAKFGLWFAVVNIIIKMIFIIKLRLHKFG